MYGSLLYSADNALIYGASNRLLHSDRALVGGVAYFRGYSDAVPSYENEYNPNGEVSTVQDLALSSLRDSHLTSGVQNMFILADADKTYYTPWRYRAEYINVRLEFGLPSGLVGNFSKIRMRLPYASALYKASQEDYNGSGLTLNATLGAASLFDHGSDQIDSTAQWTRTFSDINADGHKVDADLPKTSIDFVNTLSTGPLYLWLWITKTSNLPPLSSGDEARAAVYDVYAWVRTYADSRVGPELVIT